MLLIIGFYKLQKPILRILCLAGLIGWIGSFVFRAISQCDWNMMIFPVFVGLGWAALHPLLKEG
jgi:hypothetical protein